MKISNKEENSNKISEVNDDMIINDERMNYENEIKEQRVSIEHVIREH